jgi:hypothetical protein
MTSSQPHHPQKVHYSNNPYMSSDEEEETETLINNQNVEDTYSHSSQHERTPQFINHQRHSTYTTSQRALKKLIRSQGDLQNISLELQHERSRARYLLIACVIMSILCGFLFIDRWPKDWRGDVIAILDPNSDTDGISTSSSLSTSPSPSTSPSISSLPSISISLSPSQKLLPSDSNIDILSKYVKWNLPYKKDRDIPLYWHIPLTGAEVVDEILGKCYKLVQATDDPSILEGHEQDKILNIVSINSNSNSKRYVNVDMGSIKGIKRAKELRLVTGFSTVELIRTSHLYEATFLFQDTSKYGKCFTLLRSPIQRSIDVFHNLKVSSSNPVFKSMSLQEYVKSSFVEDNWMVRILSNEMALELTEEHLNRAKSILGGKFIVGFTEDFEESMRRFAKYFRWDEIITTEELQTCQEGFLASSKYVPNKNGDEVASSTDINNVKEGDEIYNILQEKNVFDNELYLFAKGLYETQALYGH